MARIMTSKEIESEFGIPAEQLEKWADDAEKGIYHGEPRGEVRYTQPGCLYHFQGVTNHRPPSRPLAQAGKDIGMG